uniref:Uncharacterized protein n=1 Tax=Arundo donax TaxID=35708 RepID=A0A0A9C5Z8_ARUDO
MLPLRHPSLFPVPHFATYCTHHRRRPPPLVLSPNV